MKRPGSEGGCWLGPEARLSASALAQLPRTAAVGSVPALTVAGILLQVSMQVGGSSRRKASFGSGSPPELGQQPDCAGLNLDRQAPDGGSDSYGGTMRCKRSALAPRGGERDKLMRTHSPQPFSPPSAPSSPSAGTDGNLGDGESEVCGFSSSSTKF